MKYLFTILLLLTSSSALANVGSYLEGCKDVTESNFGKNMSSKYFCVAYTKGVIEGAVLGDLILLKSLADSEEVLNKIDFTLESADSNVFDLCFPEGFTVERFVLKVKEAINKEPRLIEAKASHVILATLINNYQNKDCK